MTATSSFPSPRVGLDSSEQVLWHGQPRARSYAVTYTLLTLFLLTFSLLVPFMFGVWLLIVLWTELARRRTHYFVTNQRLIQESGIFSSTTREGPLDRVTNVATTRSLLGMGGVEVTTNLRAMVTRYSSRGSPYRGYGVLTFDFRGIRDADFLRDIIMQRKQDAGVLRKHGSSS